MTTQPIVTFDIPMAFHELFTPADFKVYYGGRDGAKSWSVAAALVSLAYAGKQVSCEKCFYTPQTRSECEDCQGTGIKIKGYRFLCARELQSSIRDSVHRLLQDIIELMGLRDFFVITDKFIRANVKTPQGHNNSEFIFKGLHHNASEIKSTEGIDICWVEEGQIVSKESWDYLIPTIRKEGSEIWVTFNPREEKDDTWVRFIKIGQPNSIVRKVSWRDNPHTSAKMTEAREFMKKVDHDGYMHIYEGELVSISEAVIFRNKYVVEDFATPGSKSNEMCPIFKFGADFGFGPSPACMLRCFTSMENAWPNPHYQAREGQERFLPPGPHLWVDYEAYGWGVDQDDLSQLYDQIPGSRDWPLKGDSARPDTISHVNKKLGFSMTGAEKWKGSIEDGIFHLKQYVLIHIHSRCKNFQQEAYMYRYKVDKNGVVLPIIVDAFNHGWDSLRYALDGEIQQRGTLGIWAKLGGR